MRSMRGRLVAVVAAASLALPLLIAASPQAGAGGSRFVDLKKFAKPKITGAEIIAGLEDFVDKFPMRQQGMPNNAAAAEFLAAETKKLGYKTRILEYDNNPAYAESTRVVEAIKPGTKKPDEWIAFVAHYDIVPGIGGATIEGAYDDGSGTNILRYFAKAFSKMKTNRSIAILWFDGEENGLLGSQAYVEDLQKKKQKVFAALGFDMVGIGYPSPYCICIYHGPSPEDAKLAVPIIDYVNKGFLKFPMGEAGTAAASKYPAATLAGAEGMVCSCGPNIRNSDESTFAKAGYFSMRWTGMRTASDYPGYHFPWDTVPFMEHVAGSRENLEQGTENSFLSAFYSALVLDNL